MRLRARLLLTLTVVTVPLLIVLVWFRYDSTKRTRIAGLKNFASFLVSQEDAQALCERDGGQWPRQHRGPPPHEDWAPPHREDRPPPPFAGDKKRGGPPRFFVFDASFKSVHEDAPALDPVLIAKLGSEESADIMADRSLDVLVRLPWNSQKCAYLLAREQLPRHVSGHWNEALNQMPVPAALVLATMIVLWLALSGVVRRLHTLADEVTRVMRSAHKARVPDLGRDEIGMVAMAFNAASDDVRKHIETVEAREQTLREFLANTTHDIMIPLTVLQGLLSKAPASDAVLSAREEAYYIGSLLSNLSAVAKLEAGTTHLHRGETKLDNIVERAVERYRGIAAERGVSLEIALPGSQVLIDADPTLVEQCVSNLVYNAVRYNKRGGYVAVVLDVSKERFTLRVTDDGPGMSDEERARALERGFRSQRARRENPDGLGLGLSIVRAVTDLHQWTLTLARSQDGGLEAKIEGAVQSPASAAST